MPLISGILLVNLQIVLLNSGTYPPVQMVAFPDPATKVKV